MAEPQHYGEGCMIYGISERCFPYFSDHYARIVSRWLAAILPLLG